jgi:ribokinase
MDNKRILVVGSLNMDIVINLHHLPQPGETIIGRGKSEHPGGKGANQAFAAARLGGNISMIGRVGADKYGETLVANLKNAGADTSGIIVQQGTDTGLAFIYVDEKGENTIVVASGANALLSPEDVRGMERLLDECDIVLIQLEIPHETVAYTIEAAHRRGKTVVLNPAPVRSGLEELYGKVDILTPNEGELEELSGVAGDTMDNVEKGARALIEKGAGSVIVTLGEKGALLVNSERAQHFPAKSVKAVDTTAAGDAFSAAVCVALAEGKSIDGAIRFANKVSGIVVTRMGAQPSIPHRSEVDEAN